ncbi:hypothetical protein A2335_05150 [Candidatus Peregrinibacteria bacterium RIFOXYB2_FULL_32_7]|nr:MAG: hypothetical protein A2335_05150 [Candidatus Peregrinibacteria bacterium RIFOXYB2_FULL_32_7]
MKNKNKFLVNILNVLDACFVILLIIGVFKISYGVFLNNNYGKTSILYINDLMAEDSSSNLESQEPNSESGSQEPSSEPEYQEPSFESKPQDECWWENGCQYCKNENGQYQNYCENEGSNNEGSNNESNNNEGSNNENNNNEGNNYQENNEGNEQENCWWENGCQYCKDEKGNEYQDHCDNNSGNTGDNSEDKSEDVEYTQCWIGQDNCKYCSDSKQNTYQMYCIEENNTEGQDQNNDGQTNNNCYGDDCGNDNWNEGEGDENKGDEGRDEEELKKEIERAEKDLQNQEQNLRWREKDLKRAERLEKNLIKEQERLEKKQGKDGESIDFTYDDFVNWDLLTEIQTGLKKGLENYKLYIEGNRSNLANVESWDDMNNFYRSTKTQAKLNLEANQWNICLDINDQTTWLFDLKRKIAEYENEAEKLGVVIDEEINGINEEANNILVQGAKICEEVQANVNSVSCDITSLTEEEDLQNCEFDIYDLDEDNQYLRQDFNDLMQDLQWSEPWEVIDFAWKEMDQQREFAFLEKDLEYGKNELLALQPILEKIQNQDEFQNNRALADKLLLLDYDGLALIIKAQEIIKNGGDKEEAFDILKDLEDLNFQYEDLLQQLERKYLEKYLNNEEFDLLYNVGGDGDNRHKDRFEEIGIEGDMAEVIVNNISEAEALKIIQILLNKVNVNDFEDLIGNLEDGGYENKVGVMVGAIGHIEDETVLNSYIGNKKAVLEYLDDLQGYKLREVRVLLEDYSFAGPSGDEILLTIENYLNSDKSDQDTEDLKNKILDLREEDIKFKTRNGVMSFQDVDDGQWYFNNVETLKESGVISGKQDGNYHPQDFLTNAEILKIALEVTGNAENLTTNPNENHWAKQAGYTVKADSLGIDFNADLNASATRGYVLYLLEQVAKIEPEEFSSIGFPDVDINHQYADFIEYGRRQEWVSGDDGTGNFRPDDSLNRAEVAKIVNEFIEDLK